MDNFLLPLFQAVSVIFAFAAVGTGAQGVFDPVGFSKSFGLSIDNEKNNASHAPSYVVLMGVRQASTGIILLVFVYQRKWNEIAIILSVIGLLVARVDGIYLARSGATGLASFHAIPGTLIAFLAMLVLYLGIV